MQTEEFIKRVRRAGPDLDPEAARAATLATVHTLCEHLPAEESRRLAAQLPNELAVAANEGGKRADLSNRPVELSQFYEQVALRAEIPHSDATGYARAVTRTLKDAVGAGEISDVVLELPPELTELLAH